MLQANGPEAIANPARTRSELNENGGIPSVCHIRDVNAQMFVMCVTR